jgi:hypothetical protein
MVEAYLRGLLVGPRFLTVLLPSDTDIRKLMQVLRVRVRTIFGKEVKLQYLWARTEQGIILAMSGNRLLTAYVASFLNEKTGIYFQSFEVLHESHAPVRFERELRASLETRLTSGYGQLCRGSK